MNREHYPTDCLAWPAVSVFEVAFPTLDWRLYSNTHFYGCKAYLGVLVIEVQPSSNGWLAWLEGGLGKSERVYAKDIPGLVPLLRGKLQELQKQIEQALFKTETS